MKKFIIYAVSAVLLFLIVTATAIYHYLTEYGFTANELTSTMAVYFHMDDGFTVRNNKEYSTFIGNTSITYYADLMVEKGYKVEQSGSTLFVTNDDEETIAIDASPQWCHWFCVYTIEGNKLEDL